MSTEAIPLRKTFVTRDTNETKIQVSLSIDGGSLDFLPESKHFAEDDGCIAAQDRQTHASQSSKSQQIWIWTGIGFLDHMLHALAKHAGWSLRIRSKGDLYIDDHHTTEDTFLALGTAFNRCLGDRTGLARFGDAQALLDEARSSACIDLSHRPFFVGNFGFKDQKIGALTTQMIHHGLQSWSHAASVTLHVTCEYGENDHHRAESAFKALAVACRRACERIKGREGEVISTKGVLGEGGLREGQGR